MADYTVPNSKVLAHLPKATEDELKAYVENAQRYLPDAQWLLDAVGEEQNKRGGFKNFSAQAVRKILIEAAKDRQIKTYKEVTNEFGVEWPKVHRIIPHYLGEISTDEHLAGRPLLSAIVVGQGKKVCGEGFFTLARRLGYEFMENTKYDFMREQQERVFDFWRSSTP